MIRVLLVLGLVACDREAREGAAPAPSPPPPPRVLIPRPSASLHAIAPVEHDDDVVDDGPPDDEGTAADDDATDNELIADHHPTDREAIAIADHQAVAIADKAVHDQAIAETTDRDVDDIPDVLDKCPDIPEDEDGSEDIDGCPDPR
jgi:hypothetical protein